MLVCASGGVKCQVLPPGAVYCCNVFVRPRTGIGLQIMFNAPLLLFMCTWYHWISSIGRCPSPFPGLLPCTSTSPHFPGKKRDPLHSNSPTVHPQHVVCPRASRQVSQQVWCRAKGRVSRLCNCVTCAVLHCSNLED